MESKNEYLDQLFDQARNAEPAISYDEAVTALEATVIAAGSAGFLAKLLTLKKGLIMLSISSFITVATVVVIAYSDTEEVASTSSETTPPPPVESSVIAIEELDTPFLVVDEKEWLRVAASIKHDSVSVQIEEAWPITSIAPEIVSALPEVGGDELLTIHPPVIHEVITQPDTSGHERIFKITNETKLEKLEEIDRLAEQAGVLFKYKMKRNGKKLKAIKIQLLTSKSKSVTHMSFDGKFDITIGWVEGEDGKACKLYRPPSELAILSLERKIDHTHSLFEQQSDEIESLLLDESELQKRLEELQQKHKAEIERLQLELQKLEEENGN